MLCHSSETQITHYKCFSSYVTGVYVATVLWSHVVNANEAYGDRWSFISYSTTKQLEVTNVSLTFLCVCVWWCVCVLCVFVCVFLCVCVQTDTPEDMNGWIKDISSKIQDFRGPSKVNILFKIIRFQPLIFIIYYYLFSCFVIFNAISRTFQILFPNMWPQNQS